LPFLHAREDRGDVELKRTHAIGDPAQRAAVRALIVALEFLEAEMDRQVSHGFRRGVKHGRFNTYSR
jgi:hypothetical protein